MKKTLIVAAVAASFATAASAQSSVTLYGLVDAGITYTSNVNGDVRWAQTSGAVQQSRWGLRGSEDLGGGLKAIFNLEDGFNLNDGSLARSGRMFSRQAFVGLSSDFGTVTLGRQFDAAVDYLAPLSATGTWGGTYFAHPGDADNLNATNSSNNTVKFASANYAGFTFGGTYSFSNEAGAFANNRAYSAGAAYENQGLRVAAAYAQENNPNADNSGASDGSFVAGNFRQRTFGVGAGYTLGAANVGLLWTQTRLDNGASVRLNNYEVNGKYSFTPAMSAGLAYTFTDAQASGAKNRVNQVGVQGDYALSRRTDVYAEAVYQRVNGDEDGIIPTAVINGAGGASSTRNQGVASVGLRHRF
ncbi:MAG TPA: porin [Paraburkholderia sp.]|nr:porin [Paraburkholderia sp.]